MNYDAVQSYGFSAPEAFPAPVTSAAMASIESKGTADAFVPLNIDEGDTASAGGPKDNALGDGERPGGDVDNGIVGEGKAECDVVPVEVEGSATVPFAGVVAMLAGFFLFTVPSMIFS